MRHGYGKKKFGPLVVFALLAVLLLTACGQQAAAPAPAAPAPAAPAPAAPAPAAPAAKAPDTKAAAPTPGANWPKQFMFAAAPKGGAWYPIAAGLVDIIQEATGTKGTIIEAGGNANVIAINDGKAHFAMAQVFSTVDGIAGKPPFKSANPKVQGMVALFDGYWQMMVPKSSNIMTMSDLKGKRISCGIAGQATVTQCEMVLKAYGLSFKDMAKVEYVPYNDAALMMKDKQLDGLSPGITGFPASAVIDVATSVPLRALPISDEALAKIRANNTAFLKATLPAKTYNGMDEPVPVLKTATGWIVSPDLPEDYVYTVIKAIDQNKAKLQAVSPTMKNFDLKVAAESMTVTMHPGVVKYLKEKGILK